MAADDKRPDVWMPFMIDRYLGDTTTLTTEEHGAYVLILLAMWKSGGMLPDDDKKLANAAKLSPAKWRRMRETIRAFLRPADEPGHLTQKRLHAELTRAERRSTVGKDAAKRRWQTDAKPDANPYAKPDANVDANVDANHHANTDAKPGANVDAKNSPFPHSPFPLTPTPTGPNSEANASESVPPREARGPTGTAAGFACKAMKAAGIAKVSPSNVDLLNLLEQGMTVAELVAASEKALANHADDPFTYALKVARAERERAAKHGPLPPKQTERTTFMATILARGRAAEAEIQDGPDGGARS